MGLPVIVVAAGGLPVIVSTNGYGLPCTISTNGYGLPVTQSTNGSGLAVIGVSFGPTIQLSAASVLESAAVNTTVGTLSVSPGTTGTPVFTLVDSAGGKFNILGTALRTNAALDYETATNHTVIVAVSGVTPTVSNATFIIIVGDVAGPAAPVLALTSGTTDLTPDFTLTGDLVLADVVRFQYSTSAVFSGATDITNAIDAAEDAANTISFSTGSLAAGTWYFRARIERGTEFSGWSNTETITLVGSSYAGPGNVVASALAWWGLRAYNATTAGTKAVRLIRSSDSTQADISTLGNGNLDLANAFFNGSTYKVVTLYDQASGTNAYDVTQPTDANRPLFILNTLNSKPVMRFAIGSALWLKYSGGAFTQAQPLTYSAVAQPGANANNSIIISCNAAETDLGFGNPTLVTVYAGTFVSAAVTSAFHTLQAVFNGASSKGCIDGATTTGAGGTNFPSSSNIGVGSYNGTVLYGDMDFVEGGIWGSDISASFTALNSNQTTYWGPF